MKSNGALYPKAVAATITVVVIAALFFDGGWLLAIPALLALAVAYQTKRAMRL